MRKTATGVVTSDKADKSRRVEIRRLYQHSRYGKIVRGRTVCHVHDEQNVAKLGDTVEIIESRPRSKTKRWDLVRVVKSAQRLDESDAQPESQPETQQTEAQA